MVDAVYMARRTSLHVSSQSGRYRNSISFHTQTIHLLYTLENSRTRGISPRARRVYRFKGNRVCCARLSSPYIDEGTRAIVDAEKCLAQSRLKCKICDCWQIMCRRLLLDAILEERRSSTSQIDLQLARGVFDGRSISRSVWPRRARTASGKLTVYICYRGAEQGLYRGNV